MGNTNSNSRDRGTKSDFIPTQRDNQSQAFVLEKKVKSNKRNEDDEETSDRRQSQSSDKTTPITTNFGTKDGKNLLPTVFKWEGGGNSVFISGTFSEWKPLPMVKSQGDFVTILDLAEGEHEFKFCVDGQWKFDPTLKTIDNTLGTKNNVVCVKDTDFEVFQALDMDSELCQAANRNSKLSHEYTQEIPSQKPWERIVGPPILPPHLLQVILNKDTPLSCEPTLLPEPNHVMLNHLYALSIKDGVMVLSATYRYRKKYVTTLLYKPIVTC